MGKSKSFCMSKVKSLMLVIAFALTLVFSTSSVSYASGTGLDAINKNVASGKVSKASKNIDINCSKNSYKFEEGGTIQYYQLVNKNGTIKEDKFNKLSNSGKEKFLGDMIKVANATVDTGAATNASMDNWLKQLQNTEGVGTKLLSSLLQNTKTDLVTANRIYEPFSGIVGTLLGLGSICLMSLVSISMVLDLVYIGLPFFRAMEGEGGSADKAIHWVSSEAKYAVKVSEEGEGKKVALAVYFKKRVVMLIVLGICMLYLVQGHIFTFVGWCLDLLSGFLGF